MKRLITIILAVLFIASIAGAVEDSFTITVTVEYIGINLRTADDGADYVNWPLGTVAAGAVNTMTTGSAGNHVLVKNGSNVALDFSAYSTTVAPASCGYGTATAWTAGTAAGADIYLLEGGKGTVSAEPGTYTTFPDMVTPGTVYAAAEPAGTDHHFYARFTTPTSVSDGCEHTITVFIVAQ